MSAATFTPAPGGEAVTMITTAGPCRLDQLACDAMLDVFQRERAIKPYFALCDAMEEAGMIPVVAPFQRAA